MQPVDCLVDCTCPTARPNRCKKSLAAMLSRNDRIELRCSSWLHACSGAAPARAGRAGETMGSLTPPYLLPHFFYLLFSSLSSVMATSDDHLHLRRPDQASCKSCSSLSSSARGRQELSAGGSGGHELATARSTCTEMSKHELGLSSSPSPAAPPSSPA
ncbi:uncharacterized protein [Oryza sativa Japonica Group]|jgi:hypothetical protein